LDNDCIAVKKVKSNSFSDVEEDVRAGDQVLGIKGFVPQKPGPARIKDFDALINFLRDELKKAKNGHQVQLSMLTIEGRIERKRAALDKLRSGTPAMSSGGGNDSTEVPPTPMNSSRFSMGRRRSLSSVENPPSFSSSIQSNNGNQSIEVGKEDRSFDMDLILLRKC